MRTSGAVLLRWLAGVSALVLLATASSWSRAAAVAARTRRSSDEAAPVENALREAAKEGYEKRAVFQAPGEEAGSGEANREGPRSPAAEAVLNRAYPRSYVDDRLARSTRRPSASPDRAVARPLRLRSRPAPRAGDDELEGPAPFTPNVPGEASQFIDPGTLKGPSTQESGRVTAIVIDPACTPGVCRMAVAAAGGGIWTTDDALAPKVTWTPPPNDLPTTSFGSLYYDAAHDVLYAGSGEPNGSSDSEAGLGLFKSTDFGASWSKVPGSAAVATNRAIGAIAVDPNDPKTIYIGTAVAGTG